MMKDYEMAMIKDIVVGTPLLAVTDGSTIVFDRRKYYYPNEQSKVIFGYIQDLPKGERKLYYHVVFPALFELWLTFTEIAPMIEFYNRTKNNLI